MNEGALLTKVTIWLALCGYVAGIALLLLSKQKPQMSKFARLAWTFGCAWFLVHVFCAFNYYYKWSHTIAYAETARQTNEVMGTSAGDGVYVSYAFTLVWVADVLWWWLAKQNYERRPVLLKAILHGFMFFILFNGTVIFKSGPMRWLGILFSIALGCLWLFVRQKLERKNQSLTEAGGSF